MAVWPDTDYQIIIFCLGAEYVMPHKIHYFTSVVYVAKDQFNQPNSAVLKKGASTLSRGDLFWPCIVLLTNPAS